MSDWIQGELAESKAASESLKINWLKNWEDKTSKTLEIDFSNRFEREEDDFGKLQIKIPAKEGNELKIWGVYPTNPIYQELLDRGSKGHKVFKILMQKMKTKKGNPGKAYTILESS